MPIFYKGAGLGTHWHRNDARNTGFIASYPRAPTGVTRMMEHIIRSPKYTPYMSLTRSYSVAWIYAKYGRLGNATKSNPGYVYEIQLDNPLPRGLNLFDPVKEVSGLLSPPLAYNSYQHNGLPSFLLGVVDPIRFQKYLSTPVKHPPHVTSGPFTASLSDQLDVLVRTLRDAEIIALGHIPSANVVARYDVW